MSKERLSNALKQLSFNQSYGAYTEVSNALDQLNAGDKGSTSLKLALLRNFTLEPLVPVLKGEVSLANYHPEIYLGGYDTIAQDVLDLNSEFYSFKPDLVFLVQWLETLAPEFVSRFVSLSESRVTEEIDRVIEGVSQFIVAIRKNIKTPLIFNNFVLPTFPAYGILDAQSSTYQMQAILKLNIKLSEMAREFSDVYVLDIMSLMARTGSQQGVDERYWQLGRAPIGRNTLIPLGRECGKFVRALFGRSRKCLVLDCDNVLWDGILGEEGIKSINASFQREILNLHDRGVILALCSKNNEDDVIDVLKNHSEMILREKHIAARQINWADKVTNLLRIAEELNIGLDSLVFADDSSFECDLVRERLPQVAVLCLSGDSSLFSFKLQEQGYFDTLSISLEDKRRNQMYQEESQRKSLIASSGSMEDYLASLDMVAEIGLVAESNIPRVAQLTQKTNQFNLTTHRYTEANIRTFASDPNTQIFYLKLIDHVSDIGLVGVVIIKYKEQLAEIDTLLLSCRALGRGVEDVFISFIKNIARSRGYQHLSGKYIKSEKNTQVSNFYERAGFAQIKKIDHESDWLLALGDNVDVGPQWIKVNIIEWES